MKHIATMALMLNLGIAGVYAQQNLTESSKDGIFGNWCAERDQSTAAEHKGLGW